MIRRLIIATGFCFVALSASAKEPQKAWLPAAFNGWQAAEASRKSGADATAVDAADSSVLKEYGFADYESATYSRNGRSLQVKAARFNDASGALGAFSYYMQPQMRREDIGDRAVSNNSRILFYRGNILVDVTLERVTAMSAADLRALAEALPRPRGENSVPPNLPGYLPKPSLVANTDHYVEGPRAFERLGASIPSALVDFSKTHDVELARYSNRNGEATLVLVEYPTPQIAAERLRAWQAASLPGAPFYFRRSGPLLAAVNGALDEREAQALLASINYDADVTWNQPSRPDRNHDSYGFIVALILLVVIILGLALLIGMMFGGLRVWTKKFLRGGAPGTPEEVEFIRLNLK
jgi:hypothetical protein